VSNKPRNRPRVERSPACLASLDQGLVRMVVWECNDPNCEDGHNGHQGDENEQSAP